MRWPPQTLWLPPHWWCTEPGDACWLCRLEARVLGWLGYDIEYLP